MVMLLHQVFMWCWQPEFRSSGLGSQDFYPLRHFPAAQTRAVTISFEIIHHHLIMIEISCSKYSTAPFRGLQDLLLFLLPRLILKVTLCGKYVMGQQKSSEMAGLTQGFKSLPPESMLVATLFYSQLSLNISK